MTPYLDSMIQKHKKNCWNPVGKRLYIRDYDDNGKRRFVSWGLTCTTCGIVVKEKYERNLTKQERQRLEWHQKPTGEKYEKLIQMLGGRKPLSDQEYIQWLRQRKLEGKLKRLERRRLGKEPITPKETRLRKKIKRLNERYSENKNLVGIWDSSVVEKFLYVNPRPTISELEDVYYSSHAEAEESRRVQGKEEAYTKHIKHVTQRRQDLMKYIIKSRETL